MKSFLDHLSVFIAGASILSMELVGARMLAPFFGTGIFVWASLLTVVLAALTVGYFLGGILSRRFRALEARHFLVGAAVFLGTAELLREPILRFGMTLGLRFGPLAASAMLLFPAEFFCAAVSPVVAERGKAKSLGMAVGRVSGLASLGSIVGALCTGFFLIPALPLDALFFATGLTLAILSFLSLVVSGRKRELILLVLPLAVLPGSLLGWFETAPGTHLIYRGWSAYGQLDVMDLGTARIFLIDRMIHTVMPRRLVGGVSPEDARLPGNYFSLLKAFRPDGRTALVIGLGGGLIPKLLSAEGVATDSVEIDPKVVNVARRYFGYKGRTIVADGRAFLRRTSETYDFIVLDAFASDQLPVHLFSKECFEEASSRLPRKGILAINFIAGPKSFVTASLKKTLDAVFPHVLFVPSKGDESVQVLYVFAGKQSLRLLGPSAISEGELLSYQRRLFSYPPDEGMVVTDNRNPLELHWAAIAAEWRRESREYLEFLLSSTH